MATKVAKGGGSCRGWAVNWNSSVFSTIDLGSFSNLWFWLMLAVAWSGMTHHVLGVPYDLIQRARRGVPQSMADVRALAEIQSRRRMEIMQAAGVWLVGFWAMVLSALATLGFVHGYELAQALTLLLGPLSLAAWVGLRLAAHLDRQMPEDAVLLRRLIRHRWLLQAMGLLTIFVTTLWGTWHNLEPLG